MVPEAFHLRLGMSQAEARKQLDGGGWPVKKGNEPNHLVVAYGEKQTVTLVFNGNRLESARFELVDFVPAVKSAFAEERSSLHQSLGPPSAQSPANTLIYDNLNPNIFVVMSLDPKTEMGRQGLGFLVVRYFVPPPR